MATKDEYAIMSALAYGRLNTINDLSVNRRAGLTSNWRAPLTTPE